MCEQRLPSVPQTFLSLTNALINWFIYNISHVVSCCFFLSLFISTPTLRKNRKSNWHKTPDSLYYKWTTGKSIVLLCLHAINSFAPGKRLLMIWINTLPSPPAFAHPSHLSPTYHLISLQINSPKGILPLGFFRLFYFLFTHSNMNPCESNYSRASPNPLKTWLSHAHCDTGLYVSA